MKRKRHISSGLLFLSLLPVALATAQEGATEPTGTRAAELLVLGPLPLPAPLLEGDERAKSVEPVPELEVKGLWPRAGDAIAWFLGRKASWTAVDAAGFELAAAGDTPSVTWIAVYLVVDRYGEVGIAANGAGPFTLYLDGSKIGSAKDGKLDEKKTLGRGLHRLLVRAAPEGTEAAPFELRVTPKSDEQQVRTTVDPRHPISDYDALREVGSMSGLAMSPDGALLALTQSGRSPAGSAYRRMDLMDLRTGIVIRSGLGGDGARPLLWSDDSESLLFRAGADVLRWRRGGGAVERVLIDEPGLGSIAWSKDGSFLVFASSRGVEKKNDDKAPKRRVDLREKLTDWPVAPHLHLLELASGARRRLAVPGDWVQDSFAILPDHRTLVYLRSVPIDARPWFQTEVRRLDLETAEDRVISTVVMGFENRPGLSGMAVSPDGRLMAFVGPPSELGDKLNGPEPNAFDPDLFVMDLESGRFQRVTEGIDASVAGHLHWSADSSRVSFLGTDGAVSRVYSVAAGPEFAEARSSAAWFLEDQVIRDVSQGGDGAIAAFASGPTRLPALYMHNIVGRADSRSLNPNQRFADRWSLSEPVDVSFARPDGVEIEAWLYRPDPLFESEREGKRPLILYYYGGATPTTRGFNGFHQFLTGNGYAVLVVNPRGASGYGQGFADHHVADWGEKAGEDILRALDRTLAENPDLDPERVGCYGGSYGGFMTMHLVSRSDHFAAAVSLYGISNLASYFGDGMWGYTYGDQAMAKKYPWQDPEWYTSQSPLFAADRVYTPLLLLHGESDGNVPVSESEQMFTALKLLGREVELVRFPGEDHGIGGTWKNRSGHRTMLLEWFDKHLKDQPAAWKARWKDS